MSRLVTGEPIPVEKTPVSRVVGATVNGTGSFVICAERVGAETLLARIVQMVAEAQRSRAPIQRAGGSGIGVVRADRRRHRGARVHRLEPLGPEPRMGMRW